MKQFLLIPLLLISFVLNAETIAFEESKPFRKQTIADIAISNPEFTTFVALAQSADMIPLLQSSGSFTFFMPTNAAFARLPEGTVTNWFKPENKETLKNILLFHMVRGILLPPDLKRGTSTAANGKNVDFLTIGNEIYINHAKVVKTNVSAVNGVVYGIDAVLIP